MQAVDTYKQRISTDSVMTRTHTHMYAKNLNRFCDDTHTHTHMYAKNLEVLD